MDDLLELFDLDLLPLLSPGRGDNINDCDSNSQVKQFTNFDSIMSTTQDDHPQPCSSRNSAQDGKEVINNIEINLANEAFSMEAVEFLDVSAASCPDAAEDTTNTQPVVEVPLIQDQLELIMQSTGICTEKIKQDPLQPLSRDSIGEENYPIVLITVPTTPAAPVENVNNTVSSTTSYEPSHSLPMKLVNKNSCSCCCQQEKKLKLYELPEFEDKEVEKKRQNAINAYKNRQRKKKEKTTLESELAKAIKERDELQNELEDVKTKNRKLEKKLDIIREAVNCVQ